MYIFKLKRLPRQQFIKQTLENTEEAIKNGQSRETVNVGYTRRRQTQQKQNMLLEITMGNRFVLPSFLYIICRCYYIRIV
jgi:hypothetical protein